MPQGQVFNNTCAAVAVQQGGNGWATRFSTDLADAQRQALAGCAGMGMQCEIKASFCDNVVEQHLTLICAQPVFGEERRLRSQINGDRVTTVWIAGAINYLHARYCAGVTGSPPEDNSIDVGDNCFQKSGVYRGERVYWGACYE